jgi:DNA-binding beta-propeller fold protein YncE
MMGNVRWSVLAGVFVAGLCAGFADIAEACTCVPERTGAQRNAVAMAVKGASAVFVARALDEQYVRLSADQGLWRIRMRVEEAFAGTVPETVEVDVTDDTCGVRFTVGEAFLVYAHDANGRYGTGLCMRTGIAAGHPDLQYLRDRSYLLPQARIEPKRGLLVAHEKDSRLAFIDPSSGTVTTVGEVPIGPHEIAVSSTGTKAVVTSYDPKPPNGSSLSVVDLSTFETSRHFVGTLFRPQSIAVSDDIAWYTVDSQPAPGSFSLQAGGLLGRRAASLKRSPQLIAATRDGLLMTTDATSTEVAFDSRDRLVHVAVRGVPSLIELSPDDHQLWVISGAQVTILDVAAKTVAGNFDLPIRRPGALQFLPDGGRVVITDLESGDALVLDAHTYELRGRVHVGRMPSDIAVTPNGRQAYIALTGDDQVIGLDLTRMAIFQAITTGEAPTRIVWTGAR